MMPVTGPRRASTAAQQSIHGLAVGHVAGKIVGGQPVFGNPFQLGADLFGGGCRVGFIRICRAPHQGQAHSGFSGHGQGAGRRNALGASGDQK